jgi:hypothetical protein
MAMNFKYYKTSRFVITILALSILATYFSTLTENVIMRVEMIKDMYRYVGIFSSVSLIMFFIYLLNEFLWKYILFKWLIDVPNLNGRYEGTLESSYLDSETNTNTTKKCVIEIVQNASKITINSYYANEDGTETSNSESFSEEIIKKDNSSYNLYYFFKNDANTLSKLSNHSGACKLTFYPKKKELKGVYFNDRPYKGNIFVEFKSKHIEGKL